jgi:hypothetical protein
VAFVSHVFTLPYTRGIRVRPYEYES